MLVLSISVLSVMLLLATFQCQAAKEVTLAIYRVFFILSQSDQFTLPHGLIPQISLLLKNVSISVCWIYGGCKWDCIRGSCQEHTIAQQSVQSLLAAVVHVHYHSRLTCPKPNFHSACFYLLFFFFWIGMLEWDKLVFLAFSAITSPAGARIE